jgi:AcrR family transcriptional regulator
MVGSGRTPLSRARALDAAMVIADSDGLAALTMRRLARELGVEAMSLYHHVANKDDILDAMVETVFAEIELPPADTDWKTAMRLRARSARAALTRHPWAIGIMDARRSPGPATLRHHDAVLGSCRAAGFSVELSAHAFSLIDSYLYGFVIQELNGPFEEHDDLTDVVGAMMPGAMPQEYPHLAELTIEHVLQVGYSYSSEFDFGLELILEALERIAHE